MKIIPAILAYEEQEFMEKVERVRSLKLDLHVDVMDGNFVPNTTWAELDIIDKKLKKILYSIHLMVTDPEQIIPLWLLSNATKIFFHFEASTNPELIIQTAPDKNRLGLVINLETPIEKIDHLLNQVPSLLLMGIVPGASGRIFNEAVLEKIKKVKSTHPKLEVLVDGGVKADNIAAIAQAGADTVIIGSGLTDSTEPMQALTDLRQHLLY